MLQAPPGRETAMGDNLAPIPGALFVMTIMMFALAFGA